MRKIVTAMILLMVIGLVLIGCTQTTTQTHKQNPAVDSEFEEVSGEVDNISDEIGSLNLNEDLSFDDDLNFTGLDFEG